MYKLNSRGPNTEPCVTPLGTLSQEVDLLFTVHTVIFRAHKSQTKPHYLGRTQGIGVSEEGEGDGRNRKLGKSRTV